jgi:prevent-host-death family protein
VKLLRFLDESPPICQFVSANPLASIASNDYYDYHDHTYGRKNMGTHAWTVAEAKAKFSEVIDRAKSDGPQTVTRNGRKTVVVVAAEEWERKTKRKGSLAEFFAASPLRGSGVRIKRLTGRLRKVEI